MIASERWRGWVVFALSTLLASACGEEAAEGSSSEGAPLTVSAEPPGSDFEDAVVVELVPSRPAEIIYTTDGSLPSPSSALTHTGPIRLTESTLLSFLAIDDRGERSRLVTEWYTRVKDELPRIELPPRSLRVAPDRLVFTPEPGVESETKVVRLESVGTEPVTVFAMTRGPASSTSSSYDPGAFEIIPSTTDPSIPPDATVELRVTYFTTKTSRTMILNLETDAQNVERGIFPLSLFGRMFP